MTDNEKLIEDVAKAIMEASHGEGEWEFREPMEEELYLRRARAALAVFEKAHTPTDDERGALTKRFADRIFEAGLRAPDSTLAVIAFKEVAAGFRRSEVPEPSEPSEHEVYAFRRALGSAGHSIPSREDALAILHAARDANPPA